MKKEKIKDKNILTIKDRNMLNVIQAHQNEIVYLESEDLFLIRNKDKWIEQKEAPQLSVSQYEINKMMIKQLPFLSKEEKKEKIQLINDWKTEHLNYYYMLLGKENSYYTIFGTKTNMITDFKSLGEGVIQCLKNIGNIYSIEETELKDAIEIWVEYKDEPIVMYLFPYDQGIVTIGV